MPAPWSPTSWQSHAAAQQPCYPDEAELARVVAQLAKLPPLVTSWEIESLKAQLAEAADGKRFLLQGGDCAETFDDCESTAIANKLKILLQMSLVLVHGMRKRVIRVGRFAGQYAKPRSSETETRTIDDVRLVPARAGIDDSSSAADPNRQSSIVNRQSQTLPAYRGDIVNRVEFTVGGRTPDPHNLLRGYERSALTLNFIRALIDGGFADLHHPEYWDLGFVKHSPRAAEYQKIVESIGESLRFMEVIAGQTVGEMSRVDFFTSHEALILLYEQAQTRRVPRREGWYNLATHFPWIGMRTAAPGSAHVEYARGIRNPIAIKIGTPPPQAERGPGGSQSIAEHITKLFDALHAENEPGRMTIVHRFGAHQIATMLPPLIEAVEKSKKNVLWVCDPMHGNTQSVSGQRSIMSDPPLTTDQKPLAPGSAGGASASPAIKTRKFEHILAELEQAFEIHRKMGAYLGGVHFELTGENVTECTGGARGTTEADLTQAYKSQVDPRLNYEQSLEMAMLIARLGR